MTAAALAPWDEALRARLAAVLAASPQPEDPGLLAALAALGDAQAALGQLREHFLVVSCLLANVEGHEEDAKLAMQVRAMGRQLHQDLRTLQAALGTAAYPFQHGDGTTTVAAHVVPDAPPIEDLGVVFGAAEEALHRALRLYSHGMGEIAQRVEGVEAEAGLPPLTEPAAKGLQPTNSSPKE